MGSKRDRRVVITGMGCITSAGLTTEETWESLLAAKPTVSRIESFDATQHRTRIAAEIKNFDPTRWMEARDARRTDRTVQLMSAATRQCLEAVSVDDIDKDRTGVVIGSGIGGLTTLERQHTILLRRGPRKVSPFFIPMIIADMSAGHLSIVHGFKGPNYGLVSACASAGNAIADSYLLIKAGLADSMLTGGTESCITSVALAGFGAMKALSRRNDEPERASRPFDFERDGFVMGEGAGALFLEDLEHAEKRGANIFAEVIGIGLTGDAHHMTSPAPNGEGAVRAMKMAIMDAGIDPAEVDYINAHGTSTQLNDASETAAIKKVFGDATRGMGISSTKSMIGHLLGAAAAVELIFCALAIRDKKIPPTINYENPDPQCDLDYVPNESRDCDVNIALSNAFGFGGHNCTLIVKRYEEPH